MCGILGIVGHKTHPAPAVFNAMRDTLAHRGPDDGHSWFSPNGRTALGFRRLSFLDLSTGGRQPMSNEEGNLWLTFNGEIYNYLELREELIKLGHHFKSTSDSEVLLHGYESWGKELPNRLKGMFAFAIWDDHKEELFLARDRFGIKPLYYSYHNGQFGYASELKALLADPHFRPTIDESAICDYLTYRYIPSPKTIWKEINKLPPAHALLYHAKNGSLSTWEYWQLKPGQQKMPLRDAVEQFNILLNNAVLQHVRADVPIGSFLSGGYDSSALVYYLVKNGYRPDTFSIGFDEWDNSEHQYAKMVAEHLHVPHYTAIAGNEQLDLVEKLVWHYDEPIADISIIPTYMVSGLARTRVKAVFSGEGADEFLGGYSWQKGIAKYSRFRAWAEAAKSFATGSENFFVERYAEAMAMGRLGEHNLREYLHPDMHDSIPNDSEWFYRMLYRPGLSPLKAFQYMDAKAFMGELVLTKIDRATMAHSLEARVPFLDHELVEFLYGLHESVYYQEGITKILLRENIQGKLPPQILDRPKQGFVGPDKYYQNIPWYAQNLRGGVLIEQKILSETALERMISEGDHWRLWKFMVLEKWRLISNQ